MLNSTFIGNKIAQARKTKNLSQAELAQLVSISPQAVGKWERGESLPDITTLNRLAEIFGVDLNYFSENFKSTSVETHPVEEKNGRTIDPRSPKQPKNSDWDMSQGNWVDADFSGLKNLKEKFSSSNIKNCKFLDADLSGLVLKSNHIDTCDFSKADLRNSKIQSTYLSKSRFIGCSLVDSEFTRSEINNCDFTNADFSGAEFTTTNFQKNTLEKAIWRHTSFKGTSLYDLVFEGTLEDCSFENCGFGKVQFQNCTLVNTFFKNNSKFKKVQFVNCQVDTITYAFLKNNKANLTGITVLE